MTKNVLPMFSSGSFMVSGLTLKSWIHFVLIFVYGVSWWSGIIIFVLYVVAHISQNHLLKRLSFLSEQAMAPHSSTLAWKIPWAEEPGRLQSMGSLGVGHDWATSLSLFTFTFHFHALEKEMATHSSVLAWRIPGTGEPGGLPSMGSHRAGHDWSDLAAAATSFLYYVFFVPLT